MRHPYVLIPCVNYCLIQVTEPCCACEEAKYEVTFEGLWSEMTHPRQFPSSKWLLHFSDIIGASHSADYRYPDVVFLP